MTPADLAMKAALDEGARYGNSPPSMAPTPTPLPSRPPRRTLTSLGLEENRTSSETVGTPAGRPTTPHITLHQFHKLQRSPTPSLSPELDYKRVRRKQSFATLIRLPPESSRVPAQHTSSSTLAHSRPLQSSLPPLLPPLPLTPIPRPSTNSPSLSSTVDTLQSTPTHTPILRGFWLPEQWGGVEQGGFSEPIRTKRKFLPFKQAKRLPHHSAHHGESEGTWEVHAAVVDIGVAIGDLGEFEGEEAGHVASAKSERAERRCPWVGGEEGSSRRKGRLVRFEGVETEEKGSGTEDPASPESPLLEKEKEPTLTSSFSLSKFKFPAPPGSNWEGTFGHLTEPTPPTSPATLHYKGISFDVVNPHTSLLLGVSDIETPAEIDGLLDNYFSDDFGMEPYGDESGEKSRSQQSFHTTGSNGRQRILYDDPDSARRNIMGLPGSRSDETIIASPGYGQLRDGPPMPSPTFITRPGTPNPYSPASVGHPRGVQLHPRFREVLGMGAPGSSRVVGDDLEDVNIEHPPAEDHYTPVSTAESDCSPALADNANEPDRVYDRSSSIYPHSRYSNPFDLTLSDDEEDLIYSNVDDVVAGGRQSYYAANVDHEHDLAIYDDADAANARTQSTLEQGTTIGNIVSHYQYSRSPLDSLGWYDAAYYDNSAPSASIDLVRGEDHVDNPFLSSQERSAYSAGTGSFQHPMLAIPAEQFHVGPRVPGPPLMAMPTPSGPYTQGANVYHPDLVEPYGTDATYGSTSQLLRLTPQVGRRTALEDTLEQPIAGYRGVYIDRGFEDDQIASANNPRTPVPPPIDDEDEDKENTPPQSGTPVSTLSVTPRPAATYNEGPRRIRGPANDVDLPAHAMQRVSSFYPEDEEGEWESIDLSENRENLRESAEERAGEHEDLQDARPSQESYADTSVAGSNVRLSLPPGTAIPMSPASIRTVWPSIAATSSGEDAFLPMGPTTSDEDRAKKILEGKADAMLGQSSLGTPKRDPAQHTSDMKELEAIRQKNPSAVEKAVKAVSEGIGKLTQIKPAHAPQTSASKMPSFGLGKKISTGRLSETRGLLTEQTGSPFSNQGLRFSETGNNFQTTNRRPSFLTGSPVQNYSPLTPPPITSPTAAHLRDFGITTTVRGAGYHPSPEPPGSDSIEMVPLPRRGRISRVAMSSQTELRPLQLADSTAASGFTGRLTDVQLAEAEGGWTMRPDVSQSTPPTRLSTRNAGPTTYVVNQSDDDLPVNGLMRPRDAINLSTRRIQQDLTRPYFRFCIACPITAALFGLGGLDWKMREMTGGRVVEMSPTAKKQALTMYLPLGCIIYAAIGILIFFFVFMGRK